MVHKRDTRKCLCSVSLVRPQSGWLLSYTIPQGTMDTTTTPIMYTIRVRSCSITGEFLGAYPVVWDPTANGAVDGGEWHETDLGPAFGDEKSASRFAQTITQHGNYAPTYMATFIKAVRRVPHA